MKEVGKRATHTQKRKQNKTKNNLRLATPHLLRDKLHENVTLITLYKDSEIYVWKWSGVRNEEFKIWKSECCVKSQEGCVVWLLISTLSRRERKNHLFDFLSSFSLEFEYTKHFSPAPYLLHKLETKSVELYRSIYWVCCFFLILPVSLKYVMRLKNKFLANL